MATFDYDPGTRVHYEVRDNGGPPAVLLHGFGSALEVWRDVQPYLDTRFSLYLVDLPGSGLSSKRVPGGYSFEHQCHAVAGLLEHLQLKEVVLIGHSFGGAIACGACILAGSRIRALVLIASPATIQRLPPFIAALRRPCARGLLAALPSRQVARQVLRGIVHDRATVTPALVERYARFLRLPGSHGALVAAARHIIPEKVQEYSAMISQISVPTLILWGDRDRVVFPWQANLLKRLIPDSTLVTIPCCGHLPAEEQPQQTAAAILNFLPS